jgi:hypothetical protein
VQGVLVAKEPGFDQQTFGRVGVDSSKTQWPSDLPWWAWLGGALVFAVVVRFAFVGFTAGAGILLLLLAIASGPRICS